MASGINVQLQAYGNEAHLVPVLVEILDRSLRLREKAWLTARETREFRLEPGIFGVRAALASGFIAERTCEVREERLTLCVLPLNNASPHESNEWAYFTQSIDSVGNQKFTDRRYHGAWIRLWERHWPGSDWRWQLRNWRWNEWDWNVVTFPNRDPSAITWAPDGVTYSFRTNTERQYIIQVGGPNIPWKCVALPPGSPVMILVRPTAAPAGRTHPLDVIVSTDNFKAATLLGFMQRGDMNLAKSWTDAWGLNNVTAETLLAQKQWDPSAAAVGGYYLLRVRDLERLHNWAENLANWFPYMPDGAIIRAGQMIAELRGRYEANASELDAACDRLLEGVFRGTPLYTEGLRMLRDGLMMLQRTDVNRSAVKYALKEVNAFVEASDPATAATTYTAVRPDRPSGKVRKGPPDSADESFAYIYDVPLRAAVERGLLDAGVTIFGNTEYGWKARVETDGTLAFDDGRTFSTFAQMIAAIGDKSLSDYSSWVVGRERISLTSLLQPLRELPH